MQDGIEKLSNCELTVTLKHPVCRLSDVAGQVPKPGAREVSSDPLFRVLFHSQQDSEGREEAVTIPRRYTSASGLTVPILPIQYSNQTGVQACAALQKSSARGFQYLSTKFSFR